MKFACPSIKKMFVFTVEKRLMMFSSVVNLKQTVTNLEQQMTRHAVFAEVTTK